MTVHHSRYKQTCTLHQNHPHTRRSKQYSTPQRLPCLKSRPYGVNASRPRPPRSVSATSCRCTSQVNVQMSGSWRAGAVGQRDRSGMRFELYRFEFRSVVLYVYGARCLGREGLRVSQFGICRVCARRDWMVGRARRRRNRGRRVCCFVWALVFLLVLLRHWSCCYRKRVCCFVWAPVFLLVLPRYRNCCSRHRSAGK